MKDIFVIKIGGVASDNLSEDFFQKIKEWKKNGKHIVLVHGGGHYISEMMERLKISVDIFEGLRVTTPEILEITKMVLIGQVQPTITSLLQKHQLPAIGLQASDCHLLSAKIKNKERFGLVGEITSVNSKLLIDLFEKNYLPVIAPLGITEEGQWLNSNADQAACKLAQALQAEKLYLLTDVPGVKKAGTWLSSVTTEEIEMLIAEEVVTGGMIPKVKSAQESVQNGVKEVHITNSIHQEGTVIHAGK